MNDRMISEQVARALDAQFAFAAPSPQRREEIFGYATGGKQMKKAYKFSLSLALILALALLTVTGAIAAALLSAQEVVEQTAVPLAKENDTDTLVIDTYTPDQVAALIRAANENGITLDETTGIMQALRNGEGYWEDEAVMEICRAAFGGLFPEWTIEEKHWYQEISSQMSGYPPEEQDPYPLPGESDMPIPEARETAARLIKEKYPEAAAIDDPALYRRNEWFTPEYDDDGNMTGASYSFDFIPNVLTLRRYSVYLDRDGTYLDDDVADALTEGPYTAPELVSAVSETYRARTGTQSSWSQEAWHIFGEYLPGADRENGWSRKYDAFLQSAYPLPAEDDLPFDQALEIARRDAGCEETGNVEKVLLAAGERHVWKISFQPKADGGWGEWTTREIDAQTGEILYAGPADTALNWSLYVPDAVLKQVTEGMLTQKEAVALAADALRKALGDDSIPFEDPACFDLLIHYNEMRDNWSVRFRTKDLRYGSCMATVNGADRSVLPGDAEPMEADGDSLYRRWQDVYGYGGWDQDTWVAFSEALQALEPTEWQSVLLKQTVYLPLTAAKLTRDQAVDIAAKANDWPVSEATRATLLGMDGKPVWKIRLSGGAEDWLYELDGDTGEILSKTAYKPDNYVFDDPVEMYTLRRDYAPAFLQASGPEWAANVEICKAFADMEADEPDLGLLDESLYRAETDGRTVTFTALQEGQPSFRVAFGPDGLPEKVEKLP